MISKGTPRNEYTEYNYNSPILAHLTDNFWFERNSPDLTIYISGSVPKIVRNCSQFCYQFDEWWVNSKYVVFSLGSFEVVRRYKNKSSRRGDIFFFCSTHMCRWVSYQHQFNKKNSFRIWISWAVVIQIAFTIANESITCCFFLVLMVPIICHTIQSNFHRAPNRVVKMQ